MARRYDTYKDSGVQLLGDIPEHWKIMRYGTLFKLKPVKQHHGEELLSVFLNLGVIRAAESEKRTHAASEDLSKYQLVEPTDFVMNNQQAWRGSVGVSKLTGIISPAYHIFNMPTCFDADYANALLRSRAIVGQFEMSSRGVGSIQRTLNFNWLNNKLVPVPPLSEQHTIVSYLDNKCGKIDEWIEKKQKEVELLGEMKQRVIADAVTRGLNPNVKMKQTNIPWLPEVPEHWDIKPIRSLLKESEEKSETGKEELLSLSQYTGITYKKDAGKTGMFEAESTIGYKIVHVGQFVMNIMLAWNGSYAVSNLKGIISPAYCVFNFICNCDKLYYDYLLRIKAYSSAFKTESRGIIESRLRLYPNKFYPFHIPVPPLSEQHAIVSYITERTAKIDKLVENVNREIENLKEYKQRLISDVVTGQIKVC